MLQRPRSRSLSRSRRPLCMAVGLLLAACTPGEVPEEILGHWTTDDPRYEGRALVITPVTLEFASDAIQSERFLIEDVEIVPGKQSATLYALHYRDEAGAPASVRLERIAGEAPALRFEHHEQRWARVAPRPASPGGHP